MGLQMIVRRLFVQLGTSALALPLPAVSQALSLTQTQPPTHDFREQELPTAIEGAFTQEKRFKVIGVGGFGCSVADHVMASGMSAVECVFADSQREVPAQYGGQQYVQLNRGVLKYYSSLRERLHETEEAVLNGIRSSIEGTDILFIAAGLGGCTGSRAAPVIALVARGMGIATVGVMTLPLEYEGPVRAKYAGEGQIEMQANVDSLIVRPLDLVPELDELNGAEFLKYTMDQILSIIGGIVIRAGVRPAPGLGLRT